jgi:hypothetical protein
LRQPPWPMRPNPVLKPTAWTWSESGNSTWPSMRGAALAVGRVR